MDRQDLDGLGVGLEPAAALLVARVLAGLGDPPAQPRGQGGHAELLGRRLGVEELADVAEVGQPALAVDRASIRSGSRSARVIVSVSEATPLHAQDARPVVEPAVDVLPARPRRRRRSAAADQPKKQVRAAAWARLGWRRPLDRLEQPQPLAGRLGARTRCRRR